ncbi:DUF2892 domain-containing protein [Pseudooceanicola sp. LIPI14-2-Ac024]|uniref:YgaP family membrane protein n=1 Tax=Pseudooceanicola sp. LIPI14-2-Ac024 TaxID=3344875 RepID=UPI0035D0411C
MTRNMGTFDRILRAVVAAVLIYLVFGSAFIASTLLVCLAVVAAAVFGVTAILGRCPLYTLFGIRTCRTS